MLTQFGAELQIGWALIAGLIPEKLILFGFPKSLCWKPAWVSA